MKYILTTGWEDGVADLTERLVRELAEGHRVLWLVSGGSNIPASVQIMDNIPPELSQHLGIMLADERYGDPGHSDSNWAQLLGAGFEGRQAKLIEILQPELDFAQTVKRYNQLATKAFKDYDRVIAQLGIGSDGHVSGILPDSPAIQETTAFAIGYQAEFYQRLTLTFAALDEVQAAYAFAFGNTKREALLALYNQSVSPEIQPAQFLKRLPEAYIYNDQVGSDD